MTEKEQLILNMYSSQRKKKIIIVVCIFIVLIAVGCMGTGVMLISSQPFKLKDNTITIEYGLSYTPSINDFVVVNDDVNESNTFIEYKITNEAEKNYANVGQYDVVITHIATYHFKNITFHRNIEKRAKVIIQDTTAPTFSDECPTEISIMQITGDESKQDLAKYFTASDLSGICNIEIKDDTIDYKTAGNYNIEVVATDQYNNKSKFLCNIIVTAPKLILKQESITLTLGESTKVDVEYNGTGKPQFISSDTSIITVDDDGNIKSLLSGKCYIKVSYNGLIAMCDVTVKEKKMKTTTSKTSVTTTKKSNQPSTKSNTTTKKDSTKRNYPNKDFLFSDGYTMDNVADAAYAYLKASGKAGKCVPLKNDEGIYIGMRVEFN